MDKSTSLSENQQKKLLKNLVYVAQFLMCIRRSNVFDDKSKILFYAFPFSVKVLKQYKFFLLFSAQKHTKITKESRDSWKFNLVHKSKSFFAYKNGKRSKQNLSLDRKSSLCNSAYFITIASINKRKSLHVKLSLIFHSLKLLFQAIMPIVCLIKTAIIILSPTKLAPHPLTKRYKTNKFTMWYNNSN